MKFNVGDIVRYCFGDMTYIGMVVDVIEYDFDTRSVDVLVGDKVQSFFPGSLEIIN